MNARHTFGRLTYAVTLDSAAALIEAATRTAGRIARVAVPASPGLRVRLLGELALVENVLDEIESAVTRAARLTLKAAPTRRALPRGAP